VSVDLEDDVAEDGREYMAQAHTTRDIDFADAVRGAEVLAFYLLADFERQRKYI